MTQQFDKLIKDLRAEVEALKTIRRKSSLTFETVTKTATGTAVLHKNGSGTITCKKAAVISIVTSDPNPFVFGYSQPSGSTRGRKVDLMGWTDSNGRPAILAIPSGSSNDSSMANNSNKNVTITVYITATTDFTTTSSQVTYDGNA